VLTAQQVAKRLQISDARVRQLVLTGKLRAQRFGRQLAFREEDVEAFQPGRPGRPLGYHPDGL
jgi:excisionase family DNA binding protein